METLILILVGFVTVWLMFPQPKKNFWREPNPVYHKKFWREVREDEDRFEYPGPMPM